MLRVRQTPGHKPVLVSQAQTSMSFPIVCAPPYARVRTARVLSIASVFGSGRGWTSPVRIRLNQGRVRVYRGAETGSPRVVTQPVESRLSEEGRALNQLFAAVKHAGH